MNDPRHLSVEQASRLAVTATVADLEDWARAVAVHGQVDLEELVDVLDTFRLHSVPHPARHGFTPSEPPAFAVN